MLAEPPATSYLWRDVARDLERDWRCFMPDLVGSGASERPPIRRGYALDAQAQALRRLLDVLGLPRVAVVGSGTRGRRSRVELAARLPERVAALSSWGRCCTPTPGRRGRPAAAARRPG